ncbi:RT0821/Lpp0805 family surface protein [Brucella abortus]|nr:RT0821/Lpp0805 family surface protein [Brucella abortus]
MGGFSIEKAVPDASAITGSVQQAEPAETDTGKLSDQSAIKNVVSSSISPNGAKAGSVGKP